MDFAPFWLSFRLASVTTLILLPLGIGLVCLIRLLPHWARPWWQSVVSLPLVLPPSVLGYYLLVSFSPTAWLGQWAEAWGLPLAFSFTGLVVGSVIFSLPFMVNPIVSAIESLPPVYEAAAYSLGKGPLATFFRVLLPNVKQSVLTGAVMAFAHTVGEFGVVLMIGGNIPEQTRTASIAIYHEVEMLQYEHADRYALILLVFSFVVLSFVYGLEAYLRKRREL